MLTVEKRLALGLAGDRCHWEQAVGENLPLALWPRTPAPTSTSRHFLSKAPAPACRGQQPTGGMAVKGDRALPSNSLKPETSSWN